MLQSESSSGQLVIHTSGDPSDVVPAVKTAVLSILPDVPLRDVRTMEEVVFRHTAQQRLNMLMLGLLGILGLVISVVGIFGLMSYVVSQRTREIGVRMALGATRSSVVSMVLRQASSLVALGLTVGTVGAWYLSAAASTFLPGGAHSGRGLTQLTPLFSAFIPVGRSISPVTKSNWERIGVEPDVTVPAAEAVSTAHIMALRRLLEKEPDEVWRRNIRETIADLTAERPNRQ